jgi:putative FmdB family regulatory protein
MPIYEYACTACGERTEARQSFDDPPLEECPVCGGKLRKLYSPVGIVFKGSGFYSTDAKSSKSDKSSTTAKSDSSKEKKPEKKSESSSSSGSSTTSEKKT